MKHAKQKKKFSHILVTALILSVHNGSHAVRNQCLVTDIKIKLINSKVETERWGREKEKVGLSSTTEGGMGKRNRYRKRERESDGGAPMDHSSSNLIRVSLFC